MNTEQIQSQPSAPEAPVLVEWRARGWKCLEAAQLLITEGHGASFALNKRPEIGQVVRLTFPADAGFGGGRPVAPGRQKNVWALVWATAGEHEDERRKQAAHRDRISVLYLDEEGSGSFTQAEADRFAYAADCEGKFSLLNEAGADAPPSSRRTESRLELPYEVVAEVISKDGEVMAREIAVTENISRGGAALRTTLKVDERCLVRLTIPEQKLVLNSVVRACRVGRDGVTRAHLQFTDGEWPLGDI
jgi:hypothetical protein